jgi:flagellar biogenesis protein FliO
LALTSRNRMPGLIEVISRTSLSPRQSLCLVRVGPRLVLVGVSQDSMRALDVIEDGSAASRLSGEAARRKSDSVSAEFDSWLQEESGAYARPDEQTFETSTRMGDVKRQLAGTIRRIKAAVGTS